MSNAIDNGMPVIGHILAEGFIFGLNNGSSYIGFNIDKIYIVVWKSQGWLFFYRGETVEKSGEKSIRLLLPVTKLLQTVSNCYKCYQLLGASDIVRGMVTCWKCK